ncbi:MAG: phenylalanine--tRNA ligase subunit alpha [Verrucomicrobiota bacterium]|nr:phenylalanine--tRNA ligase subunit alpha [Verrucomicrobiota bacterium]
MKECEDILKKAKCDLGNASSEIELNNIKAAYVGKKGTINAFLKQIPSLPPNERPKFGKKINMVKKEFSTLLKEQLQSIKSKKTTKNNIDISLPGRKQKIGRKHPVSAVIDEIVSIFRRLGFIVADGPDIEDEYHNFDALNTPADHPSRDLQDTFYLPNGKLLRTQTSPVQIRVMENTKPPIRIIAPGRCYRHDTPDSTHSMNFHQIEGLYVDKNVSLADLKAVLLTFAHEIFGKDVKIRFRPHFFPFTEPSIEYDFSCVMCNGKGCRICKQSGWLEISGAGMVDPAVFEKVGYDPNIYSGYAFGMGIERIAMLLYAISDIRLLYENDIRFLKQF